MASEYDYTCKDAKIYSMDKDQVYNIWKSNVIDEKTNKVVKTNKQDLFDKVLGANLELLEK